MKQTLLLLIVAIMGCKERNTPSKAIVIDTVISTSTGGRGVNIQKPVPAIEKDTVSVTSYPCGYNRVVYNRSCRKWAIELWTDYAGRRLYVSDANSCGMPVPDEKQFNSSTEAIEEAESYYKEHEDFKRYLTEGETSRLSVQLKQMNPECHKY